MRQLLLLRHAKSSWDDSRIDDHDRPLAPRGRKAVAAMRQVIRDIGLSPDLVLVSTARRTMQTLEALEPWDDTPLVEPMDVLYLATARQLLGVLNNVSVTVRSVLLVGHNPGLHELALLLVGPTAMTPANPDMRRLSRGYPTGALAEFAVAADWSDLREGGGRLQRLLVPRDLPTQASA